ncbi:hypothetical protein SCP_0501350 [Sparassis crispa]|uniref:Uncharacterized protein n=1 Tax=Sparassis crispa TaxID=139825 RepID=A0A401GLS5_9APHY|nr:hypothetical protein SCP_0501350 [Sparassis crispa]GBE83089.1 hypothetical protein SCP_0501350 [Sparassis crispa]
MNIPQDPGTPMQPSATAFVFLDAHTIALAGFLSAAFGTGSLELQSEPTTDDPKGLIDVFTYHLSHIRTFAVYASRTLLAYTGNRLLAAADPLPCDYSSDDEDQKGPPPRLHIFDFSQPLLELLFRLDEEQRDALSTHIVSRNVSAQVRVVSRKYVTVPTAWDEPEIDAEYLWPTACPPEWQGHLVELYERDQARREGESPIPAFEYDEGPVEHRDAVSFGYVQTRLQFTENIDIERIAITSCGVVEVPGPMNDGWVFYFDEAD